MSLFSLWRDGGSGVGVTFIRSLVLSPEPALPSFPLGSGWQEGHSGLPLEPLGPPDGKVNILLSELSLEPLCSLPTPKA